MGRARGQASRYRGKDAVNLFLTDIYDVNLCRYCQHVSENPHQLAAHMRTCKEWKTWRETNLTHEVLYRLYVVEERSMPEIAEMLNLQSVSTIYNDLKKFGIIVRDVSTSVKMPRKQQRSIATCIERYGAINSLSATTSPRKYMHEKLLRERGVKNVFQLPEVKEKIRDTLVDRQESITSRFSAQHQEMFQFLEEQDLSPEIEFCIPFPPHGYRSYDIKVGTKLIEVHGDYWHANPKKYKPDDVVKWSMGKMTAQQIWARDEFKRKLAILNGYELFVVWESDWKQRRLNVEQDVMSYMRLKNA